MTATTANWALSHANPDSGAHARTLFSVSNGFIGVRGFLEEDEDVADQVFVNGFYETWPIVYPEDAYGLARTGQTIQPAPNPARFSLIVNGYSFDPHQGVVRDYRRTLDFKAGVLRRHLTWVVPDGTVVTIDSSRLVSAAHRECVRMEYSVSVSADAQVELSH
ncbi:MAG: glycoside hydrolase family 65 protein, partial [Propionibacteriaceae bacterium]|nr:glycoside hydrolase family 65 protein [Propionibacteriaceae bacterium]